MLDDGTQAAIRSELLRLTPSGDLLDLAREMRQLGVESLLFAGPTGRIQRVVTDRQIASLAADPELPPVPASAVERAVAGEVVPVEVVVPRQQEPVRAELGGPLVRP